MSLWDEVTLARITTRLDDLPNTRFPEVAFTGRSNVGKSSLINKLTGEKNLARTSNTPGRTQQLFFFNAGDKLTLVDMPGYGYAKAPIEVVKKWNKMIRKYLQGRPQLRRVMLLIDSRHGVMEVDEEIMKMLDEAAVTYQIVLTKCDKISEKAAEYAVKDALAKVGGHPACHPEVILTSAETKDGIDTLRRIISDFAKG